MIILPNFVVEDEAVITVEVVVVVIKIQVVVDDLANVIIAQAK